MQAIADYLNNIQILLLCYSVVDLDSVQDAEKWVTKISKSSLKEVVGIVVGCKKDLTKATVESAEQKNDCSAQGKSLATNLGFDHFTTSSVTGDGIQPVAAR